MGPEVVVFPPPKDVRALAAARPSHAQELLAHAVLLDPLGDEPRLGVDYAVAEGQVGEELPKDPIGLKASPSVLGLPTGTRPVP